MLKRSTADWMALLEPHAVPCAPILDLPGVFAHPQVVSRGMLAPMATGADDAALAQVPLVANPMRFDGQRAQADQPPPGLDQHGDALREALRRSPGWPGR